MVRTSPADLRLRFRPGLRVEIVPTVGVFLITETGSFLIEDSTIHRLAPFLDGSHTVEELFCALDGQLSPSETIAHLERLRNDGHIVEANASALPPEQEAFWDLLAADPSCAATRLRETQVAVRACGEVHLSDFEEALRANGVLIYDNAELAIVITDDYLNDDLAAINQKALEFARTWLLVCWRGPYLWVGPALIPGATGCWECLAHRLRGHRKLDTFVAEQKEHRHSMVPAVASLASTRQTILGFAATEIARWIAGAGDPRLDGRIRSLSTLTHETRVHRLVRRPQCPACGDPSLVADRQKQPLTLTNRMKSFVAEGGHRTESPTETFERLKHHISPITGIVRGMRKKFLTGTGRQDLMCCYAAEHSFSQINQSLESLRENLIGRSGGKGASEVQARTSALCESIERYSGVFQGDEARFKARFADLEGAAIHPNACMLFSDRQYKESRRQELYIPRTRWVPRQFDEVAMVEWSPAWSLVHELHRYLPTAFCFYGYAEQFGVDFARADSNGCAAGNSREEAVLQGFMELVERDSVAIWWFNKVRRPAVELASFGQRYFDELATLFEDLGIDLWVLDITSDLGVPSFAALSRRKNQRPEQISFGFGAHFDARLAISRALTELNQCLPPLTDDTGWMAEARYRRDEALDWWQTATLQDNPYLVPLENTTAKTATDYPVHDRADLYDDVIACRSIVERNNLDLLLIDQTRPDTGLDVVKVIVPGLRHFWSRFAPGRLYDVPVQMGWLSSASDETDLNPMSMFF